MEYFCFMDFNAHLHLLCMGFCIFACTMHIAHASAGFCIYWNFNTREHNMIREDACVISNHNQLLCKGSNEEISDDPMSCNICLGGPRIICVMDCFCQNNLPEKIEMYCPEIDMISLFYPLAEK